MSGPAQAGMSARATSSLNLLAQRGSGVLYPCPFLQLLEACAASVSTALSPPHPQWTTPSPSCNMGAALRHYVLTGTVLSPLSSLSMCMALCSYPPVVKRSFSTPCLIPMSWALMVYVSVDPSLQSSITFVGPSVDISSIPLLPEALRPWKTMA